MICPKIDQIHDCYNDDDDCYDADPVTAATAAADGLKCEELNPSNYNNSKNTKTVAIMLIKIILMYQDFSAGDSRMNK